MEEGEKKSIELGHGRNAVLPQSHCICRKSVSMGSQADRNAGDTVLELNKTEQNTFANAKQVS